MPQVSLYQPLHILVRTVNPEGTRGGIHLALSEKMPRFKGQVVDVGRAVDDVTMGETVYFQRYAGSRVDTREELYVFHYNDLYATRDAVELRALGDHVIVQEDTPEKESAGGVIFSEAHHDERYHTGTVVAVGPGRMDEETLRRVPVLAKPGDRILYALWSGVNVTLQDGDTPRKFTFVRDSEIIAAVTP